ncbi:hypothetical protein GIB67_036104 [Kingdonia uniflora]|uniref:Uncharacterized protein n=1 Tax=Kingdonia uniflora TaxID=39325 RepID=A0A7J7N9E5_9MAGN|nr:hypothetical protein GIB67_036104 [Kingdonia uniflora]
MAEERNEGEKPSNSGSPTAVSPNETPSLLPRKRLSSGPEQNGCVSPDSSASASSIPFQKKTRLQPNFSNCHGCSSRVTNNGKDKLRTLKSEWRIVLLCKKCLEGTESSIICSYCFRGVFDHDVAVDCGQCRRRIHCICIPKHRDFGLQSDPGKARHKALIKCKLAGNAAQLATNALALVASRSSITDNDAELAFQLHRKINTSKRISKILCATNSESKITCKNPERSVSDSCIGTVRNVYRRKPKLQDGRHKGSEDDSGTGSLVREPGGLLSEVCDSNGDITELPVKEDQGSCSNRVLGSSWDDSTVESESQYNQEQKELELEFPLNQNGESVDAPQKEDMFLFKYSRRRPKAKVMLEKQK